MNPKTFIFIGCSGCGKGTQAKLLQEYIKEHFSNQKILYAESGDEFRNFLKGDSYTSSLAKEINKEGKLQPAFLSIWVWASFLIKNLNSEQYLIIDGTPRKLNEAYVLDEALRFYKRDSVYVIYINVKRQWAMERLKARKREDDKGDDNIRKRLDWFETSVAPAINFYRENLDYTFLEINGEQPIKNVHSEIIEKLQNLKNK